MSTLPPVVLALVTLVLATLLSAFFLVPFIILCLDARGRFSEYLKIRWRLRHQHYPSSTYLLRSQQQSFCGRWAATSAFNDEGIGDLARVYYRSMGYRWYHIFPDNTFSKRCPFIKPSFWVKLATGR